MDLDIVVMIDDFAAIRMGPLHHHDPQSEAPVTDRIIPG